MNQSFINRRSDCSINNNCSPSPPPPIGIRNNSYIATIPSFLSKKERLVVERDLDIQRGNQIMLRKLLEIDHGRSELSKKNVEPVAFKVRKSKKRRSQDPTSKGQYMSMHPQLNLKMRNRLDELREVAQSNIILMKKLNEAKPSIDALQIESDQKKKIKLSHQMSRNGTKFIKHPFFISENPAATLYRNLMDQGGC